MRQKNFFKLALLISAALHFFLIVFFPIWETALPAKKKPKIVEVALIKVKPKPVVTKIAAPPPVQKKTKKKVIPRLSPVEVKIQATQNIPVLTPRVESKSEMEVAFPAPEIRPAATPRQVEPLFKVEKETQKAARGSPEALPGIPPKIPSPVKGGIPSFVPSAGSEEAGTGKGAGVQGPVGITFKGLGTRRPERAPQPTYPREMEEKGIEGEGRVRIYVAATGEVLDVEIIRTSGWRAFDKEIHNTLLKWRFSSIDEPEVKTYEGEFYFRFVK